MTDPRARLWLPVALRLPAGADAERDRPAAQADRRAGNRGAVQVAGKTGAEAMMQQALDFERRNAMQAATDRADRDITGWSDVAYRFLRLYASRNEEVFAEDVTKAAQEWGLAEPPDPRSWGSLYQRAVREGLLIRTTQSRKRANGSLAMVYKSGRV